jgi:hypothetical protein
MRKKRVLNKSTWPAPNQPVEAALGRFIIAWNVLEQQIDFAIREITRLDYDLAWSVTANLGTKAKLDTYWSMAHCLDEVWVGALLKDIDRLIADTGNASGKSRTFLIHGQPFQIESRDGPVEAWVKLHARKGGIRGPMMLLSAEAVDHETASVKALVERWIAVRTKVFDQIEILDIQW